MLQQPHLAFSCTVLKIQGESTHIHVANVYARDNQLNLSDIQHLFNTYNNLILAGNLNAKHHLILPHTQKTKYNSNGTQLHMFLEGLEGPFSIPTKVTVHNDRFPESWTHITECGTHVQIDYIISSSNISHLLVDPVYEENLLSDHQGISIRAPFLFPEFHTPSTAKFILDWTTFDSWNYKFITECKLDAAVINGNWHEQPLEEKINVFTQIQKYALDTAAMKKQVSNRGNTKPKWLVDIILQKRRIQNGLRYLASRHQNKNRKCQHPTLTTGLPPSSYPLP